MAGPDYLEARLKILNGPLLGRARPAAPYGTGHRRDEPKSACLAEENHHTG
jgi:hypothetical protein